MIEINEKTNCCACQACFNICPKQAIEMVEDENGFMYPKVNKEKCINCGVCEKVCPILNQTKIENTPKAFACMNKNEEVRLESTSGGIFTLIATVIIKKGGVVFGAAFDEEFGVYHTYCETIEELKKFRGSKYLQSNIKDSYKKAKEFLDSGRYVLFTGTPCQIEGFKSYLLGKEYSNLYLQDIICHGVPSPKVWKLYKEYREKKIDSNLTKMSFRSKKEEGWNRYHISMNFENQKEYTKLHNDDVYMKAFLKHLSLRESCTDCKFKKKNRISDITLADFWGIKNIKPELNDEKGTSLVIVNSGKGKELLNAISSDMICEEVNFEIAISFNKSFFKTSEKNPKSNQFFIEIEKNDFEDVVKKFIPAEKKMKRLLKKIKRILFK